MDGFTTVIIPAKNEAELLPATLAGVLARRHVGAVVVVDDNSEDATADLAAAGGATVLRRARSNGKAGALMAGADHALRNGLRGDLGVVLLDADVGASVEGIDPLLDATAQREADLAIAKYVARGAGGGRGRVVRLARAAIRERSGWESDVPLSGIRHDVDRVGGGLPARSRLGCRDGHDHRRTPGRAAGRGGRDDDDAPCYGKRPEVDDSPRAAAGRRGCRCALASGPQAVRVRSARRHLDTARTPRACPGKHAGPARSLGQDCLGAGS